MDGDDTGADRPTLVVYHRDGIEVHPLVPDRPVVIGRTEPSDIQPRSRRLSRRHAQFVWADGVVWVEDLRSTNGTYVNGQRIAARTSLATGDEVTLGSVTVSLRTGGEGWLTSLGLESHAQFESLVGQELDRARTFDRPLTVVMLRARDPRGPRLGTWVPPLARRLRKVDRAALFGPDCVEVLLPEMDTAAATSFAESVVSDLADLVPLYAGIAVWPEAVGGRTAVAELLEMARAAATSTSDAEPVQVAGIASGSFAPVVERGPVVCDTAMLGLYRTVKRVANSMISVLIVGETGTGKELIARAIHDSSDRHGGPLKIINCGAIPPNLLESLLFGHERGSFTGADQRREGVFVDADHGTVFLDEVGELPLLAQVALLRVLETRRIIRVGSTQEIPVDVRVLAATHRNLEAMCDDGSFRWDLLYRLNAVTLVVPPLRDRSTEIRPLVQHFLAESNRVNGRSVKGVTPDAMALLERYRWPGNVRELRNTLDRAVVVCGGDRITPADLPERLLAVQGPGESPPGVHPGRLSARPSAPLHAAPPTWTSSSDDSPSGPTPFDLKTQLRTFEIDLITAALSETGGNQTLAAAILAIPRRTLVYKIRSFDIRFEGREPTRGPLKHEPPVSFSARLDQFERQLIDQAMSRARGDLQTAARLLNIQKRTLASKLDRRVDH
ncbi:MAG: sigma 54-interacting transcriptional regulator [Myxococcota bacterium]